MPEIKAGGYDRYRIGQYFFMDGAPVPDRFDNDTAW